MNRRTPKTGVYLLANDAVWRWTSACAESLRSFNPELRVVVIPYDDELRIIERLCARHSFELWHGPDFAWADQLGKRLGEPRPQMMRKLAAFDGPLEHFLYLDVDTVVLMDLEPALTALTERPAMVMFAGPGNVDEVYRPGPWRERFVAEHGTRAGNAGVWAAARGTFTPTQLARLADAAEPIAAEFPYPDQGFLNFCLDSTGAPVGNLRDLLEMPMMWAGDPNCLESEAAWNAWWTKNHPFTATVRMLRDELGPQWKVIANRVGVAPTTARYLYQCEPITEPLAGGPRRANRAGFSNTLPPKSVRDPCGRPVGLVHWAGYGISPEMPLRSLWEQWAPTAPPPVLPRAA